MNQGIVIKSTGSWYSVYFQGKVIQAKLKGVFRIKGIKLSNPIAVGDNVKINLNADGITGTIYEVVDRKNYIIRKSPRQKNILHILASNIDQALVITTVTQPMIKPGFIDRFLLMTECYSIPAIIVFNKKDLYQNNDMEVYRYISQVYESIGYQTFLINSQDPKDVAKIKSLVSDKTTLFGGQSGVGKSTLINSICPTAEIKTGELSEYTGKGKHTTSYATMYFGDEDTKLIDTPGIKTLSFNHYEKDDILHNYKEIHEKAQNCKFQDCTHRTEPQCAVKEALEREEISEMRYSSFCALLEELEDLNFWERVKNY